MPLERSEKGMDFIMNREMLNEYKNKEEKMLLAQIFDKIENTNKRNTRICKR